MSEAAAVSGSAGTKAFILSSLTTVVELVEKPYPYPSCCTPAIGPSQP